MIVTHMSDFNVVVEGKHALVSVKSRVGFIFTQKTCTYGYMTSSGTTGYCLLYSLVFVKKHSCQTALITLTEDIYNAIQTCNFFGLLQLDLSKAFDLVNHTLIFEIWNFTIVMMIQSAVDPLLFLIYINDTLRLLKQINTMLYANDATIL